ncbi:hypothetical protein QL093DRAFT_2463805 [Fusarium oxysporum]|nr:hypothetical protein QL093DRAFT_2463805 [Fusarium oxysporum]
MNKLGDNLTVSQELSNPLTPLKPEGQPVYLTPLHLRSNIVSVYSTNDPVYLSVALLLDSTALSLLSIPFGLLGT